MIENYGIRDEKVKQIYNPINVAAIMNSCCNEGSPYSSLKRNIILIGRFNSQKRIEDAIAVMSLLPNNYHLHILGDGDGRRGIENKIKANNLTDKITLHGFIDNPYPFIKNADCLISTSRYEGLPNVVIEAIALGTPVVCYNCPGGTAEIVIEGKNGFLIEDGNVEALSIGIRKCIQTQFDYNFIKRDAYDRFNINNIVSQYEKLFTSLIR